jgi:hypothetical protein
MRNSIRATYDSRETGPQYWVTSEIGDRTVCFRQPADDPFVRHTVTVGLWDAVRELLRRRRVEVTVLVGATRDRVDDVLELDGNTLVPGDSTRRAAWDSHINERLGEFGRGIAWDV